MLSERKPRKSRKSGASRYQPGRTSSLTSSPARAGAICDCSFNGSQNPRWLNNARKYSNGRLRPKADIRAARPRLTQAAVPLLVLCRLLPEVGNHICSLALVRQPKAHRRSGCHRCGILEPAVERHRVPGDIELFQSGGIVKARNTSRLATKDSTMFRADTVEIQRVAGSALGLVNLRSPGGAVGERSSLRRRMRRRSRLRRKGGSYEKCRQQNPHSTSN